LNFTDYKNNPAKYKKQFKSVKSLKDKKRMPAPVRILILVVVGFTALIFTIPFTEYGAVFIEGMLRHAFFI
jgi:hypothetical protein